MTNRVKGWIKDHILWRWRIRPEFLQELNQKKLKRPTVFYLGTPEHGNLGDQAIAYATEFYLQQRWPEMQVISVPNEAVHDVLPLLTRNLRFDHAVVMHGGGNIGDLWPDAEEVRRAVVAQVKENLILQMPQSVHFDNATEHAKSQKCYNHAQNLMMVGREEMSHGAMQQAFKCASMLAPDMVMWLSGKMPTSTAPRNGVMTIFRTDKERLYGTDVKLEVMALLEQLFDRVTVSDTVISQKIQTVAERNRVLHDFWQQMASHEVIVTDRLHGMIFGLITQTPTVALANNNGKIAALFETWLRAVPWITLWTPSEGPLDVALVDVMRASVAPVDFDPQFSDLDNFMKRFMG